MHFFPAQENTPAVNGSNGKPAAATAAAGDSAKFKVSGVLLDWFFPGPYSSLNRFFKCNVCFEMQRSNVNCKVFETFVSCVCELLVPMLEKCGLLASFSV